VLGVGLASCEQLRDHSTSQRQKVDVLARFKESNERSAPFFFGVRSHGTCKQYFRSKKIEPRSWWSVVLLSTCDLRAGVGEQKWVGGGMISDSPPLPSFSR
jgi:hypothetical protein